MTTIGRNILLLTALMTAACTGNETVPDDGRDQITFSVAGGETKADGWSSMSASSTFGSCAWLATADEGGEDVQYIQAEEISCKDNVWKAWGSDGNPDHLYYWPSKGHLSFFAWSPYDISASGFTCDADGYSLAGWNTLAAQDDIVTAASVRDCSGDHGAVRMEFCHALSALTFIFKIGNDPTEVLTACWLESPDRSFVTAGTLTCTADGAVWSDPEGAASDVKYYYDWACEGISLGDGDTGVRGYDPRVTATEGAVFTSNSGYVLIIPQATGNEKLRLHFQTKESDGTVTVRSVWLPAEEYVAGKRYEYTVTISPVLNVSISIKDWNVRYASDDITF